MKSLQFTTVFLLSLFLTLSGNISAQTIIVSGAGMSEINQDLTFWGTIHGKNAYINSSADVLEWSGSQWYFTYNGGQDFYHNSANTSLPPAGGWQVGPEGTGPAPTLSGAVNPLPVELTSFTVAVTLKTAELSWKTATENNNYGFEIQRKTENSWSVIGFVEGRGTTNAPQSYTYSDMNVQGMVTYRLKQIDRNGAFTYSQQVEATIANVPEESSLTQNYPNPFNPSTEIQYVLRAEGNVILRVYDVLGNEAATLVNERQAAGQHSVTFNAANLSSGIYVYILSSDNVMQSKKMLLMK